MYQENDAASEILVFFFCFLILSQWKAILYEVPPATLVYRSSDSASDISTQRRTSHRSLKGREVKERAAQAREEIAKTPIRLSSYGLAMMRVRSGGAADGRERPSRIPSGSATISGRIIGFGISTSYTASEGFGFFYHISIVCISLEYRISNGHIIGFGAIYCPPLPALSPEPSTFSALPPSRAASSALRPTCTAFSRAFATSSMDASPRACANSSIHVSMCLFCLEESVGGSSCVAWSG